MRNHSGCIVVAFAVSACVSGPDADRAPSAGAVSAAPVSIEAQVAELERASQPATYHKELLPLCGNWNVRLVDVAADGRESELAAGTAAIEAEFGGRFLRWDTTMQFGSQAHATTGFVGYDLSAREYQSMMINDVGTGMSVARGTGPLKRSGIRFTLEIIDRDTGGRARMSSVLRMIDADHFAQDLLAGDPLSNERAVRRYHYTRAVSAPAPIKK